MECQILQSIQDRAYVMVILKGVKYDEIDSSLRNNDSRELNFVYELKQKFTEQQGEGPAKFTFYNYRKRALGGQFQELEKMLSSLPFRVSVEDR